MKICIDINTCEDCAHLDHSGAFTVRGARLTCSHPDASKERVSREAFKKEYPEYADRDMSHWKYHWIHRCITSSSKERPKEIPDWCPLKKGAKY